MIRQGAFLCPDSKISNSATVPVQQFHVFAEGDAFTRATLATMRRVVRQSLSDPVLVDTAFRNAGSPSRSSRERINQVNALRSWLLRTVEFLADPEMDGDFLRTPRYLLDQARADGVIRGDCDDVAMLSAALGLVLGLPARFHAVAFDRRGPFRHVFAELRTPDGVWHEFDVTEPAERRAQWPAQRSMILEV